MRFYASITIWIQYDNKGKIILGEFNESATLNSFGTQKGLEHD